MKKFLIVISITLGLPIACLFSIYIWTDPFCILSDSNRNKVSDVNREYLSTELFLQNKDKYPYDSYVFASSRGAGINTYTWKMYLPDNAHPFLFQAWSVSITGVQMKMNYLDANNHPINNALLLIDIPSTFAKDQLPYESLSIKHYLFTQQPKWVYVGIQFFNFIQSPSLWLESIQKTISHTSHPFVSDSITNDYIGENYLNYNILPEKDSLMSCSDMTRKTFFAKIANKSIDNVEMSPVLIDHNFMRQLEDIKAIFDKHQTNYQILITPAYYLTSQYINSADLHILQDIFGEDRVHDFSAPNELNMDYNCFSDPNHFDLHSGYIMLQQIYNDIVIIQ